MRKVAFMFMGAERKPGACEIYRANMPAHYLEQTKKWKAHWFFYNQMMSAVSQNGSVGAVLRYLSQYDVIVLPRFYASNGMLGEIEQFISVLKARGIAIVYEVDDDFTNEYREVLPAEASAVDVASLCDAILVSTPHLAKLMKEKTGRPCYVCQNSLDPVLWKQALKIEPDRSKLRIALTGSPTHYNDWKVLKDVLPGIASDYENVQVILGAYRPDYFPEEHVRMELRPALDYIEYAATIKEYDIILAPIDPDDRFNHSKSAIKVIEGMGARRRMPKGYSGAAVIASRSNVYSPAIKDGETGLLVPHTPEAWDFAIRRVLDDQILRTNIQRRGYQWCWKKRNIELTVWQWDKALRKILSQHRR